MNIKPQHDIESHTDYNIAFQMASIIYKLDLTLRSTALRAHNMTYAHYRVLQYLFDEDGKTISEIVKTIVIQQAVLSRVIDQMELRDLVSRRADERDSRYMRVYLTESGREKYLQVWPEAKKILDDALKPLDKEEVDALAMTLRRISSALLQK